MKFAEEMLRLYAVTDRSCGRRNWTGMLFWQKQRN